MVMDLGFGELSQIMKPVRLKLNDYYAATQQPLIAGFTLNGNILDLPPFVPPSNPGPSHNFAPAPSSSVTVDHEGGRDSPGDNEAFSDIALSYITQMLMEEDMDEQLCMYQESSALLATEKSLYEVLGEKHPTTAQHPGHYVDHNAERSPEDYGLSWLYSDYNSCSNSSYANSDWICNLGEYQPSCNIHSSSSVEYSAQSSFSSSSSVNNMNGLDDSSMNLVAVPNIFTECPPVWQFVRGVEEASRFHPNYSNSVNNAEDNGFLLQEPAAKIREVKIEGKEVKGRDSLANESRGRKNLQREFDLDLEQGRSNKQSAAYSDTTVEIEMFDKVLLSGKGKSGSSSSAITEGDEQIEPANGASKVSTNGKVKGSNKKKSRGKKQGKPEVVDLSTLLITCAQGIATDDCRTANELLKKIRQHSSLSGDGNERLANVFADVLEARLAGTGSQIYTAIATKRRTAADILKAYYLFISACPFKKLSHFFSNQTILDALGNKPRLHIVDIGIYYGFQWPCLLQQLSSRPGGPPKLKITGIDLPQPGFRPLERVEESGRRLAEYAKRFNVPFEYFAVAQKWETIRVEDINVEEDEVLVVNCLFRLKNLFDETVVVESPRNIVLNTIRKLNPDVFIHGIVNGAYSAPFFLTRFKEALFHYTAFFDMLEATVPREDPERLLIEQNIFGREIMNIVGCEGLARVERPETYKQWQVRNTRAGFEQLPLNQDIVKRAREKSKSSYHKDFVVDHDSQWMLQGWKGRIIWALSTWRPKRESS